MRWGGDPGWLWGAGSQRVVTAKSLTPSPTKDPELHREVGAQGGSEQCNRGDWDPPRGAQLRTHLPPPLTLVHPFLFWEDLVPPPSSPGNPHPRPGVHALPQPHPNQSTPSCGSGSTPAKPIPRPCLRSRPASALPHQSMPTSWGPSPALLALLSHPGLAIAAPEVAQHLYIQVEGEGLRLPAVDPVSGEQQRCEHPLQGWVVWKVRVCVCPLQALLWGPSVPTFPWGCRVSE